MVPVIRTACMAVALAGSPALAQSSAITETARSFAFALHGNEITISRNGPTCPGSCVQPMQISPEINTLGELEVIAFLQQAVSGGSGLLIDVRMPDIYATGTIPGAVNVPVATFAPDNPYRNDLLSALGAQNVDTVPDFSRVYNLAIFGNGADDASAPNAIKSLLNAGYPANKVHYYRGGANDWSELGLSLAVSQ